MARTVRADVKADGAVVLSGIKIWIDEANPPGKLSSWHGGFTAPRNSVKMAQHYHLELEDGRTGEMYIRKLNLGTGAVEFQGTGPLG